MNNIKYSRSTPYTFEPPFRANVTETYITKANPATLRQVLEETVNKKRPVLKSLIGLRNILVKKFGFKVDWPEAPYGPFDISFQNDQSFSARYEDPHFSFYSEFQNDHKTNQLKCFAAVHYKTPQGMVYFWSIYLFHVAIFKNLMKELSNT